MDDEKLEVRLARLEHTQRTLRRSFTLLATLLAVGVVFALLRQPPDRPRVDARELDLILRAIHEHDQGCTGHSSAEPSNFDEFRHAALRSLDHWLPRVWEEAS